MTDKLKQQAILALLEQESLPISLPEILAKVNHSVPERTLRRWLSNWTNNKVIAKTGNRRSTRYQLNRVLVEPTFKFLKGLNSAKKTALIKQLRDLWTHTSTGIEGNTLTLGDTHFVLELGLTISGKSIKDHQEVIGHARAIDLLYKNLNLPVTEQSVFDLHKAVQTEQMTDIYKPNGAWKIEPNGTYAVTKKDQQVYIEYALPSEVPSLMSEIINELNSLDTEHITLDNAHKVYSKIHAGIAHTHPFWDGNGRIARLLANIPLLRAGLPPIVIPNEERRAYIQLLAEYQLTTGQISKTTGTWPQPHLLDEFEGFIKECYSITKELVEKAHQK
jgi:Fic family protein